MQEPELRNPSYLLSHQQAHAPLGQVHEFCCLPPRVVRRQRYFFIVLQESGDRPLQFIPADGFLPFTVQLMGNCGQHFFTFRVKRMIDVVGINVAVSVLNQSLNDLLVKFRSL